jgi:hypothetical protein
VTSRHKVVRNREDPGLLEIGAEDLVPEPVFACLALPGTRN